MTIPKHFIVFFFVAQTECISFVLGVRQCGGVSVVVSEVMWSGRVKAMLLEGKSIALEVQKGVLLACNVNAFKKQTSKLLCSKEIERGGQ